VVQGFAFAFIHPSVRDVEAVQGFAFAAAAVSSPV
jgi:hypothetical protein